MLNKDTILQKMLTHFPRWMDIRKRYDRSTGGKYLISYAEEIADIQKAIDDYKKDFFIDSYIGKENKIIYMLYRGQIGNVDITSIEYKDIYFNTTENIDLFYEANNLAYYNKGFIYFKVEDIEKNLSIVNNTIKILIDKIENDIKLEIFNVWNIFDEFAAFVGLKRHIGEDNESLEYRIIHRQIPTNSTLVGLKNVIINELQNENEIINTDMIKIKRTSPENLSKYYDEFTSILDHLMYVNKDVYKTKKWDLDSWEHKFKSIDYIPNEWDVFIENYRNGIGFESDLKINLKTDENLKANISLNLYQKDKETLKQYIKNNNVKKTVNLKLKKYKNQFKKALELKYKIEASEVIDITNRNISIECSAKNNDIEIIPIENIFIDDEFNNINIVDNGIINNAKNYRLEFIPYEKYQPILINKCELKYLSNNQIIETNNLLKEKDGFIFNDNMLNYSNCKAFLNKTYLFKTSNNLIDTDDGIALIDTTKQGTLNLDINSYKNEQFHLDYFCTKQSIPITNMIYDNLLLDASDNSFYSVHSNNFNKKLFIDIDANHISFNITSGQCLVKYKFDNGQEFLHSKTFGEINIPENFIFKGEDNCKKIHIEIYNKTDLISLNNFKYNSYNISISVEKEKIIYFDSGNMLFPQEEDNNLILNIDSINNFNPYIKNLYIGANIENVKYKTDTFIFKNNTIRSVKFESNCRVNLLAVDSSGKETVEIENFNCYNSYTATNNNSYIKIDLSSYDNIENLQVLNKRKELINTSLYKLENNKYIINYNKGDIAEFILFRNKSTKILKVIKLQEALKINNNDSIYISFLSKGFIIKNSTEEYIKTINKNALPGNSFKFIGDINDIKSCFIIDNSNDITLIGDEYNGNFETAFIFPSNYNYHIAYNKTSVFKNKTSTKIVNLFTPILKSMTSDLFFKITPAMKDLQFNVYFTNNKTFSLGLKDIILNVNIDLKEKDYYEIIEKQITKELTFSNAFKINRYIGEDNAEGDDDINLTNAIDLAEYIIETEPGININYRRRKSNETIDTASEYFCYQNFIVKEDNFNKFHFSNIDEILYIGVVPYNFENPPNSLSLSEYSILYDEGIIVWQNSKYSGKRIYILYTIKIPDSIEFDIDNLYKEVEYNIDAFKLIKTIVYPNVAAGVITENYKKDITVNIDKIVLNSSSPFLVPRIDNNRLLLDEIKNENIAINRGFYYLDGTEYYLTSETDIKDSFSNNDSITLNNVEYIDGTFLLQKSSDNLFINSYMNMANDVTETYNADYISNPIKNINLLNSITACNNFNYWITFGTILSISNGLNGSGIRFNPYIQNGYAYIDITNYLVKNNLISLYIQGDIKAYIGTNDFNKQFKEIDNKKVISIVPVYEFKKSFKETDIYETNFIKEDKDIRYYLIISGRGIIDDILIEDSSKTNHLSHMKNIDKVGIKITEKIIDEYSYKIFFNDQTGFLFEGSYIDNNGYIRNDSNIDWGITKIKEYSTNEDYETFMINGAEINKNIIKTSSDKIGEIETRPIFIANPEVINKLVVQINDVLFDNMQGFITYIKTSDSYNGSYKTIGIVKDNVILLKNNINAYIKVNIKMPIKKIINHIVIFAQYKTTANRTLIPIIKPSGIIYSKIIDTFYQENYKVKNILIDSISNINDVDIFIRASRDTLDEEIWTNWQKINLDGNLNISNNIVFKNYRYFQVKIVLKLKESYIKINNIELEVV